ncbi:Hypothetical predicted protein [Octopus vulgaris]|uniref:Uncharacterized protein n=1 Tax=Octopus vulgaris TaxID=6645 RepID=A0AA36F2I3_OCTVU|nr:Hypothetical predicted protein [Octopus vulgaris]
MLSILQYFRFNHLVCLSRRSLIFLSDTKVEIYMFSVYAVILGVPLIMHDTKESSSSFSNSCNIIARSNSSKHGDVPNDTMQEATLHMIFRLELNHPNSVFKKSLRSKNFIVLGRFLHTDSLLAPQKKKSGGDKSDNIGGKSPFEIIHTPKNS